MSQGGLNIVVYILWDKFITVEGLRKDSDAYHLILFSTKIWEIIYHTAQYLLYFKSITNHDVKFACLARRRQPGFPRDKGPVNPCKFHNKENISDIHYKNRANMCEYVREI